VAGEGEGLIPATIGDGPAQVGALSVECPRQFNRTAPVVEVGKVSQRVDSLGKFVNLEFQLVSVGHGLGLL